jgi:hypothetical protein
MNDEGGGSLGGQRCRELGFQWPRQRQSIFTPASLQQYESLYACVLTLKIFTDTVRAVMSAKNFRIVKRYPRETVAVCEACKAEFKSYLPQQEKAEWEIKVRFDEHKCKQQGASAKA